MGELPIILFVVAAACLWFSGFALGTVFGRKQSSLSSADQMTMLSLLRAREEALARGVKPDSPEYPDIWDIR